MNEDDVDFRALATLAMLHALVEAGQTPRTEIVREAKDLADELCLELFGEKEPADVSNPDTV